MSTLYLPLELQQLEWYQWAPAIFGALLLGISKAGIKGIGVIIVILLALTFGGKASTGVLLPMLIIGDVFAVIYYKRHVESKYLWRLMPWMVIGVLIGVWIGKDLPDELFKRGMAVIIIITVGLMIWWEGKKDYSIPDYWWFAGIMGLLAGFTTMIGNLAGAFANIFFLAMRLPKNHFIGTAAWLFFIINMFKMPFHLFVWETINTETLTLNALMFPVILLGFILGVYLVKIIREDVYRRLVLLLTALASISIFFS